MIEGNVPFTDGGAPATVRDLRITVTGDPGQSERWARALRAVEGVSARVLQAPNDDESLAELTRDDVDAVAFATPAADLPTSIRRALIAGRNVLLAGPVALDAKQLRAIDASARARRCLVMVDTGVRCDERFAFVRKMVCGRQALWRPLYVRSLRTGDSRHSLDELAIADIATVLQIAGATPAHVSAVSPRADDETGTANVAMATLMFDGGLVARIDVSLLEPEPRYEIAVACDGRTLMVDAYNERTPLQIQAAGKHRGPQRSGAWAETINEHPVSDEGERIARSAAAFVSAVRSADAAATNLADLATAALVWERARESMTSGGERVSIADDDDAISRPVLRLIEGAGPGAGSGGRSMRTGRLAVIGRGEREETPLNSA